MDTVISELCKVTGKIRDIHGLHLRAASEIFKATAKLNCDVKISRDDDPLRSGNAKSIIALLALGATSDTLLKVTAEGPDAEVAIKALEPYFYILA